MPSYVVTGASRGIGLEFIRQLSAHSENIVVAVVRNKGNAKELAELQGGNSNIHIFEADITDRAALKSVAEAVNILTGGKLDELINNAAYLQGRRSEYTLDGYPEDEQDLLEQDMIDNFRTNVLGVVYTTNAFLPLLRAAAITRTAKVVTLSSGMGDAPMVVESRLPVAAPYAISKAALNLAVAKYAARFKEENLVFVAISPGFVNTAVNPPTAEELIRFKALVERFKVGYPQWDGLPISPETSVKMMLDVIARLGTEESGIFISHKGNQEWL